MKNRLPWLYPLFFLISLGLGYPVLNRYDPTNSHSTDSRQYFRMVEGSPSSADPHYRKRVLLPIIAKGFAAAAEGRIGSWDPLAFGMLSASALFTALSACLLILLGQAAFKDASAGLIASLLFLLNFNVANTHLGAGVIDSGECAFLLCLAYALFIKAHGWLPAICIAGALSKETFVPLSSAYLLAWLLSEGRWRASAAWTALYLLLGLSTVTAVDSVIAGQWCWPWQLVLTEKARAFSPHGLVRPFLDRAHLYIFIWLLPLSLPRLGRMDARLLKAAAAAAGAAYLLCVWHESSSPGGSALPRELFNTVGPLLCLCAGRFLSEKLGSRA